MSNKPQSSTGITTKLSNKSVAQTIDDVSRQLERQGFALFRIINHSETAERAGVQMPDSKLIMFGKPAVGAHVMVTAPPAGLDFPLKVLVWEDTDGAVWVSYNSPEFLSDRHHVEGSLRAPFDAVELIVDAALDA